MSAATDTAKPGKHFGRPGQTQRKKTGRPSTYSPEIAQRICEHIATGGYATNLKRFGLPHESTICDWQSKIPEFAEAYARARERRAETFADQIIEIADTEEDPQRARVRIDARKFIAAKLLPRVYGENQRVEVQHTLSETAARVLADLAQRQKEKKRAEAMYIDVTPTPVLEQGGAGQQDQQVTTDCTGSAPIEGQVAAPRPRRNGGAGGKATPPLSSRKSKKI